MPKSIKLPRRLLRQTCQVCGGAGFIDNIRCPECEGRGWVHVQRSWRDITHTRSRARPSGKPHQ